MITPMRLSNSTMDRVKGHVIKPRYNRMEMTPGIVHLGAGAFFRAHQAYYFDLMNAYHPRYGITAVSLRSDNPRKMLTPQDGLYFLMELDTSETIRIIGSIVEFLTAPVSPDKVIHALASPHTRMVTITVTEKGYCLGTDGKLMLDHPEIDHDLVANEGPCSLMGWLVAGLRQRFVQNGRPLTILSCDNLSGNGLKLREATRSFLEAKKDLVLRDWVDANIIFPCTMVDSITPATDDWLRKRVADSAGVEDAWPIQREHYTEWVIEEGLSPAAAELERAGVTFVKNVLFYEQAKLRLLNGAHSSLAYLGSLRGYQTVSEAMNDPELSSFIEALMMEDIAPTLPYGGPDIPAYIKAILTRFRNPAIRHMLDQIAWDGSQKLRIRLMDTIKDVCEAEASLDRLVVPLAAWMHFVRRRRASGKELVDPLADILKKTAELCDGEADRDVLRFLSIQEIFPEYFASNSRFISALKGAYKNAGSVQ